MHEPVLLKEVMNVLSPQLGDTLLDATAGYGGHSSEIFKTTGNYSESVLVDRDKNAISHLANKFTGNAPKFMRMDFVGAAKELVNEGRQFDMILADLGVSSPHLDIASRGFSFMATGPLDMRMDQSQQLTAEVIVNQWAEVDIANCIYRYGDEPKSRVIARAIVAARPISTTDQLAQIIAATAPKRGKGKHPATKTFQALRIVVNNELGLLEQALPLWIDLLEPGGRLAMISFHSLEDRIVKQFFAEHAFGYEAKLSLITKSPIVASDHELAFNPRARSAKLRAAAKINKKERTSDAN